MVAGRVVVREREQSGGEFSSLQPVFTHILFVLTDDEFYFLKNISFLHIAMAFEIERERGEERDIDKRKR